MKRRMKMKLSELRLNKNQAWAGCNYMPNGSGWYVDGHILLKAGAIKKPKPYMLKSNNKATMQSIDRLLNGVTEKDGEEWFLEDEVFVDIGKDYWKHDRVLLAPPRGFDTPKISLNAHKVKLIQQCVGVVNYRVIGRDLPVILVKNSEIIGLLMPLRP
jgi:hypothetical protein